MKLDYSHKTILNIAIPIILASLIEHAIGLIDTSLMSSLSKEELGGAGLGVHSYFFLFMMCFGLTSGIQIILARKFGEIDYKGIGRYFYNSSFIILIYCIFAFLIAFFFSRSILSWVIEDQLVLDNIIIYLQARSFGIFFTAMSALYNAFYIATNRTYIITITSIFVLGTNWFLDIALIHGNFGFPAMHVEGAAIASAIASGVGFLILIINNFILKDHKKYNLFKLRKIDKKIIKETIAIASPLMAQFFLSFLGWTFFFFAIEKMGSIALSASTLLRSLYLIILLPIIALGSTTNTLASNLIAQGKSNELSSLLKNALSISVPIGFIFCLIGVLFPEEILSKVTNESYLIEASKTSLQVIATSIVFFSISNIFFNLLIGTGDTKKTLLIEVTTLIIYIIPVYLFAIIYEFSLPVVWTTEHIYFIIMGGLAFYTFSKKKFVIREFK